MTASTGSPGLGNVRVVTVPKQGAAGGAQPAQGGINWGEALLRGGAMEEFWKANGVKLPPMTGPAPQPIKPNADGTIDAGPFGRIPADTFQRAAPERPVNPLAKPVNPLDPPSNGPSTPLRALPGANVPIRG